MEPSKRMTLTESKNMGVEYFGTLPFMGGGNQKNLKKKTNSVR